MSRSYRKPYWTEGYGARGRKFAKRLATKHVRKSKNIANGGAYKLIFNSWDICDFKFLDENSWKPRRK
jgi:hypothetical protein